MHSIDPLQPHLLPAILVSNLLTAMLEDRLEQLCVRTATMASFLPGHFDSLSSEESKKGYSDKLKLVDGVDPYEVRKSEWRLQ